MVCVGNPGTCNWCHGVGGCGHGIYTVGSTLLEEVWTHVTRNKKGGSLPPAVVLTESAHSRSFIHTAEERNILLQDSV